MGKAIYDDGKYVVTEAILATPRRLYPMPNTTAHIRRDPLWLAFGVSVFAVATFAAYGDLLYVGEKVAMAGIVLAALAAGYSFSILSIDAVGHRRALIVGRTRRIERVYAALRSVRMAEKPREPNLGG